MHYNMGMNRYTIMMGIAVMLILSSCTTNMSAEEISIECDNTILQNPVTYHLTVTGRWNTTNFDRSLVPGNAHFSPIVIFTHTSDTAIFRTGEKASSGLEQLAELGHTTIKNITRDNNAIACSYVDAKNLPPSGESRFEIQVNTTFTHVTILSMIAPSSDWFVATTLPLYDTFTFVNEGEENFLNYDAGTEQDEIPFSLGNAAEPVQKNITKLTTPFSETDVLIKVSYQKQSTQ